MTAVTLVACNSKVKFRLTGGALSLIRAGIVESFQLGGGKMENMTVVGADFFEMLSSAIGAKLDGIFGYNFLRHYKIAIYPREVVTPF